MKSLFTILIGLFLSGSLLAASVGPTTNGSQGTLNNTFMIAPPNQALPRYTIAPEIDNCGGGGDETPTLLALANASAKNSYVEVGRRLCTLSYAVALTSNFNTMKMQGGGPIPTYFNTTGPVFYADTTTKSETTPGAAFIKLQGNHLALQDFTYNGTDRNIGTLIDASGSGYPLINNTTLGESNSLFGCATDGKFNCLAAGGVGGPGYNNIGGSTSNVVAGSGYTNGTYTCVALTGGTGTGATANFVITGGTIPKTQVSLCDGGSGYTNGDVLSVAAASVGGTGSGFSVTFPHVSPGSLAIASAQLVRAIRSVFYNYNGVAFGQNISDGIFIGDEFTCCGLGFYPRYGGINHQLDLNRWETMVHPIVLGMGQSTQSADGTTGVGNILTANAAEDIMLGATSNFNWVGNSYNIQRVAGGAVRPSVVIGGPRGQFSNVAGNSTNINLAENLWGYDYNNLVNYCVYMDTVNPLNYIRVTGICNPNASSLVAPIYYGQVPTQMKVDLNGPLGYSADWGRPVGFGTNIPLGTSAVVVDVYGTTSIRIPVGTTGQRPASPVNGMVRVNTTTPGMEAYYNATWNSITAGGAITWPTSGSVVVSNATNSPTGIAETDGNCIVGAAGVWTSGSCAGTAAINIGTSASVTSPQRTGEATTGFWTSATGVINTEILGAEIMRVNASGVGIGTTALGTNVKTAVNGGLAVGTYASNATTGVANGIISSGSVGIGSATPGYPLTIQGANSSFDFGIIGTGNNTNLYMGIEGNDSGLIGVDRGGARALHTRVSALCVDINSACTNAAASLAVNGGLGVGAATNITPPTSGAYIAGNVAIGTSTALTKLDVNGPIKTQGYAVGSLPTGVVGMRAYVTDQLTTCPVLDGTFTGGGAVVCSAFYNGTAWVHD